MPTAKQLVGNSGSHHPRYHASKPPTPNDDRLPTSLNCASARERASEGARGDKTEAMKMNRVTLTTQATERFVRARPERRMPTASTSVSERFRLSTGVLGESKLLGTEMIEFAPEIVRLRGARSRRSRWTTSSSTSRMTSTRRRLGSRSRHQRRCPTAQGRTTDRYARDTPPPESGRANSTADRHRINPKPRRWRSAREGRKANEQANPGAIDVHAKPRSLACARPTR